MPKTFTRVPRRELIAVVRARYQHSTTPEKRKILQAFIAITGYHRKSAIRALNRPERIAGPAGRRPRRSYDEAFQRTLEALWKMACCPCGKRLHKLLPSLLAEFERRSLVAIDQTLQRKLTTVSAATIDRLLRETRMASRSTRHIDGSVEEHPRICMKVPDSRAINALGITCCDSDKALDPVDRDRDATSNSSGGSTQ